MKNEIIDKVVAEFGTFTILVHRFLKDMYTTRMTPSEHDSFMRLTAYMEQQTLPLMEELVKTRNEPADLEDRIKELEIKVAQLEISKRSW